MCTKFSFSRQKKTRKIILYFLKLKVFGKKKFFFRSWPILNGHERSGWTGWVKIANLFEQLEKKFEILIFFCFFFLFLFSVLDTQNLIIMDSRKVNKHGRQEHVDTSDEGLTDKETWWVFWKVKKVVLFSFIFHLFLEFFLINKKVRIIQKTKILRQNVHLHN